MQIFTFSSFISVGCYVQFNFLNTIYMTLLNVYLNLKTSPQSLDLIMQMPTLTPFG